MPETKVQQQQLRRIARFSFQCTHIPIAFTAQSSTVSSLLISSSPKILPPQKIYPFTITPPLQWIVCPLSCAESVLARKTAHVAISLGWPGRPIGEVKFLIASSVIVDGISGVHTGPGASAFTRMPLLTNWLERPRVKLTMAPLVEV